MCKRFADIVRSAQAARRVVVLLVSVGVLLAGSSMSLAEAADAPEKPKSGMSLPGEKCRVDPLPGWREPERWAWACICESKDADFNGRLGEILDPNNPKHDQKWSDSRTLRSTFLRTILLHEPFRSAVPPQGVRIIGAYFKDAIDLSDASIEWPLALRESLFKSSSMMRRLRTPKFVSFDGSRFDGELDMSSATIGSNLNMLGEAKFMDVILAGAKIGGLLNMSGSTFMGTLNMSSATIGGDLSMVGEAKFMDVILAGAKIGGRLIMFGSKFNGQLSMDSASVDSILVMSNTNVYKPAKLKFLRVNSNLAVRSATLRELDLTGTQIKGHLQFGCVDKSECDPGKDKVKWEGYKDDKGNAKNPKLTLRNTSVGVLQDMEDAWPEKAINSSLGLFLCTEVGTLPGTEHNCLDETKSLELDGFTYQHFGVGGKETLHKRGSAWFINWLSRDGTYSPQPYMHLSGVLRTAGHEDMADKILYANRAREHRESGISWRRWVFLWVLWVTVGYGYGWLKFLALVWVAVLVILGTFILRIAGERDKVILGFLNSACYSLDMLLPIIRLRERHYKDVDLITWARYFFYFHQIMGYVLIFFVLAGLSGLVE